MAFRTYAPTISEVNRAWHLLDAKDAVLGRLATKASIFLMGKHRPNYSLNMDMGDHVVIINADKIKVTGTKELQKTYHRHSGYPGGYRETTLKELRETHPERILEHAIFGMLPDNKLQKRRMTRLHVLVGDTNPYGQHFT